MEVSKEKKKDKDDKEEEKDKDATTNAVATEVLLALVNLKDKEFKPGSLWMSSLLQHAHSVFKEA